MSEEAVTTALRLIKEALFTFGAEGDECIQKLVSVQASFGVPDVFSAFHRGLTGGDETEPLSAYQLGHMTAQLNTERRLQGGLNIGPFDAPNLRWALENAARSIGS